MDADNLAILAAFIGVWVWAWNRCNVQERLFMLLIGGSAAVTLAILVITDGASAGILPRWLSLMLCVPAAYGSFSYYVAVVGWIIRRDRELLSQWSECRAWLYREFLDSVRALSGALPGVSPKRKTRTPARDWRG